MLSFFRKSKSEESGPLTAAAQPKAPKPAPENAAEAVTSTPSAQAQADHEVVVFEDISAETGTIVEEAAVYYANNMAEQAVATLSQYLHDNPHKKEMQPWLMLFDLYQIMQNNQAFNELSMQFVVKFERTAPIWKSASAPVPPRKTDAAPKDLILLGTRLAPGPQTEKLCQLIQGNGTARVSVGDVISVEPEGCRMMQEGLQNCRKKGRRIQFEGMEHLVEILKRHIATSTHDTENRKAWLLLFELFQWMGREEEYEDLAIEYAVTFEISPPAWEAIKSPLTVTQATTQTSSLIVQDTPGEDEFALKGVISESSQSQLNELVNFAADKQDVRINMADVTRVDFVAVGNFMGTLISLTQAGKKIQILEANEMVQALFYMMGIQEFAALIRRKPR